MQRQYISIEIFQIIQNFKNIYQAKKIFEAFHFPKYDILFIFHGY